MFERHTFIYSRTYVVVVVKDPRFQKFTYYETCMMLE